MICPDKTEKPGRGGKFTGDFRPSRPCLHSMPSFQLYPRPLSLLILSPVVFRKYAGSNGFGNDSLQFVK